jgi:glycosyltransferase involved in cell wall biosynthesis
MNIAFDAKRAYLNNSGLGSYSRTLIKSLNTYYPQNNYTLFTTKVAEVNFQKYIAAQPNITVHQPESFIDKKIRARWRSYGITEQLEKNNVKVYHGLSNELPFNIKNFKGKKIVTVHDLIFLRQPDLYPFVDGKIYNKKFRHACDIADTIIAISEETKADIEKYYFIPSDKIKVIYQSCDELYYQQLSQEEVNGIKEKYALPDEFLFYVGTIEERKNLLSIVKALKKVKDIPLVVAGRKTPYFKTIMRYLQENNLKDRVLFLNSVSGNDLPAMYRLAKIFILPSVLEGFGIPIIEALTSKTPVITTNGGCFPEAGGSDTIYVNPNDENELAEQINFLLNSENTRQQIADKGYEYAQKFHPAKITKQLMDLYSS